MGVWQCQYPLVMGLHCTKQYRQWRILWIEFGSRHQGRSRAALTTSFDGHVPKCRKLTRVLSHWRNVLLSAFGKTCHRRPLLFPSALPVFTLRHRPPGHPISIHSAPTTHQYNCNTIITHPIHMAPAGDIDAGGPATSSHMMKTTKRGRPFLKVCCIFIKSETWTECMLGYFRLIRHPYSLPSFDHPHPILPPLSQLVQLVSLIVMSRLIYILMWFIVMRQQPIWQRSSLLNPIVDLTHGTHLASSLPLPRPPSP